MPIQPAADMAATIDQLWIYPVKSCAGIRVPRARLLPQGLEADRAWMVVDADGVFVTQRDVRAMALIQPRLDGSGLVLTAPGMTALTVPYLTDGPGRRVAVWSDSVTALDSGEDAAQWLRQAFSALAPGVPHTVSAHVRLVQFPSQPSAPRLSSKRWTHDRDVPNQFGDGFPVLVTSTASLDELNQRLVAQGTTKVDMRRFRPNIVLGGVEAHDEDRLARLTAATPDGTRVLAEVALTKPCARCPIPNIDPDTALASPEVSDVLQTYRHDPRLQGAVTFGMNAFATHLDEGAVWLAEGQTLMGEWEF